MGEQVKWEVDLRTEVKGFSADKVWTLFEDFFNIHKLIPHLIDCLTVDGNHGKPALIRNVLFSTSFLPPSVVHPPDIVYYAKEKLLTFDSLQRFLSYQMIENNLGIDDYVGTVKVVPAGEDGCSFQWSVVVDPIQGRNYDDFKSFWTYLFDKKVQNITTLLSPSTA